MSEVTARVQLLGPVRARRDGDPVALRGVSARTALACLALRAGSVVSTDELSDALWEGDPPSRAAANLQSTISRLRRGLGSHAIQTLARGYRLVREHVTTDLVELESLLADDPGPSPSDDADRLGAALHAWDGDPLADVADTAYFLPDRTRLAELRLVARDRCHELLLAAGRLDHALVELQGSAAETPLRESTQLLLAEALHRLGRNAEALRAVDRYRRSLAEETGLDPSPALGVLEQQVLAGTPPTRSHNGGRQPRTVRWIPPETPFVGRDHELGTLRRLAERHRLVTVVGTGGVGKSRLVMELLQQRDAASVVVVLLAPIDPRGSVENALVAALGLETTTEPVLDAIAERLQPHPTLVVLDSCEHVLRETRDVVDGLLRRVEEVTIVATSRQRLGLAEEQLLLLEPLQLPPEADEDAPAVQLFRDRVSRAAPDLDVETADVALLTDICRLLDGLPLALELAAARAHLLGLTELRAQLVRGRLPAATGSRTMHGTVSWSLALLSAEARQLFGEACVFPAGFDIDAVGAVSALPDPTTPLAELVDASMIEVLGDGERRSYRILEPIRRVGADETPGRADDAYLDWVVALGGHAKELFVGWDAPAVNRLLSEHHDDFRHALAVLADRGDDERFGRLASDLTYPLARRPQPELVGLILEHSPDTPDGLLARVDLEWCVGLPERCIEHRERLLGLVDYADPRVARALGSSCPAFSFLGDPDRMVDSARQVVGHPAATDHERISGVGLWALGELYRGDPDAAGQVLSDHEDLLGLGRTAFIPFVRAEIAATADPGEALAWLETGARQARHDGDLLLARMIEVARLALLVRGDQHHDAGRLARGLIPELLAVGMTPQAWMSLRHVAALLAGLGEYETAALILESAEASPRATELVGEAVADERALRLHIRGELARAPGPASSSPGLLSAGELWPRVVPLLERCGDT